MLRLRKLKWIALASIVILLNQNCTKGFSSRDLESTASLSPPPTGTVADPDPLPNPVPNPMNPNPNPAPAVACNLNSDLTVHATPALAKPGYLKPYVDPTFGTKITRITGDPGTPISTGGTWGDIVKHQYSKLPVFNADQSLIFIETNSGGGSLFLDGNTYLPVIRASCPGSECRWHPTDASKMVYAGGNTVGYWNPRAGVNTVIASFSGYNDLLIGPWEGNLSLSGSMIALMGTGPNGPIVFAYDLVNKVKYPDISATKWGTSLDWASISPKGGYLVFSYGEDDHSAISDLNGNLITSFPAGLPSHYDMTVDANGEEVAVGSGRDGIYKGRIIKIRLKDAVITALTASGYGSHSSTRGVALRTWGVSDFFDDSNYPIYGGQIVTYNLNGNTVYRLAHTHNVNPDYDAETHASQSPDGLRVVFASNWGASRPVQVYVVDLRDKCSGSLR